MRNSTFILIATMIISCNTGIKSDFLDKLELQTLDSRSAELPGDENTYYMVNFWATWCKPCIREIPSLIALEEELAGNGLKLIFISNEDGKKVESFIHNRELGISSFLMPSAIETYELLYLPTTYLISPDGQVLLKKEGEQAWDDPVMIDNIQRLISK